MEHCQYSMVPREKINLSLIESHVADGKVRGKGPLTLLNSGYIKLLVPEACIVLDFCPQIIKFILQRRMLRKSMVGKYRLLDLAVVLFQK